MKNVIIISLFSIFWIKGYSQNISKIDSLKNVISQTSNDSILAENYQLLSNEFWSDNPKECENNAEMALYHSKKCNSHRMMSKAYQNLGSSAYFTGNINKALDYSRLAYTEAEISKSDLRIMNASLNLGNDFMSVSKFDSAKIILQKGINFARKIKDKKLVSKFYINIGNCNYYLMNFDSSEINFENSLKIASEMQDTSTMVMLFNNIAAIRISRGISDSTVIDYIMNAISIYEKNQDHLKLADSYGTLGAAYNILGNDEKTIYYTKKGIETFLKINNETKTVNLLVNLADQYREMNRLDSAGFFADQAIRIGEKNHFEQGLAAAYCIKGIISSNNSKFEEAETYLLNSFNEFSETQYWEGIFLAGNHLVDVYSKQNKYNDALRISLILSARADSSDNFIEKKKSLIALSEIYQKTNNYSKANEILRKYIVVSDTLKKIQNRQLLEEMVAKYETQKKDNEILKLKNEQLTKEKTINQQEKVIYIILFIVALLLFSFYAFRKRMQYKNEKEKLLFSQKLNKVKQEALNSQMSAHFISRTMDSINNFIQNNEKDKASKYLLMFNRLIRKVLEHSFKKSIPLKEDLNVLEDYIKLEKLRFIEGPLKYNLNIDENIDKITTLVPPMVLQTLAENSIVHGFSKSSGGEIQLNIKKVHDSIEFTIEDNGIGRKSSLDKIENSISAKKSFGSSLAEKLVKVFSEEGTKFNISDSINYSSGTKVAFTLPIIVHQ